MPKSLDSQVSFSAGELSPKLDARVDQQKYRSGMRQCRNMIPYKTGALTRRPGFQMISPAKLANVLSGGVYTHNYSVRMVPFTFSPNTSFMLEFGSGYVRFYSNGLQVSVTPALLPFWVNVNAYTPGTFVQHGGVSFYCILAVTFNLVGNAPPATDTTHWAAQSILEVFTPYNADAGTLGPQPGSIYNTDIWALSFCQINDVIYIAHPDYPVYKLTRFSDLDWIMQPVGFDTPALLDQNATDTQITASSTTGNGITLTVTAPNWVTATYYSIGNSVMVAGVNYNCVVANVSAAAFGSDLAAGYWIEYDVFNSQQIGGTWQLAYLRPSAYLELDGVASTGFATGTTIVAGVAGASWSSLPFSSPSIQCLGAWEVHTYGVWTADIAVQRSLDGGQTWDTVRTVGGRSDRNVDITGTAIQLGLYRITLSLPSGLSATPVNPGATNPRVVFECVDAFLYGLVQITAVASATSATANIITQLANTSATEYWSEAAWSNYRGFPQAVASFQQRIIYASSGFEPQRIWGTVTNDIENFALGDQTQATDSFAFDLNAPSRGPIEWLIAQVDLFAGFSGAEWVINSGQTTSTGASAGTAITPTNINAVEQSSWGSAAFVAPAVIGDAVMFTQRQATSLRQMVFSIYTNKYMSQDLTTLSDHLFTSGIVQLCYMTRWHKQSIVWVLTAQGTLCGMTYELDQEVFGWHVQQTGYGQVDANNNPIIPDNGFESVSVIGGKGTNDDEAWVCANRLIGGVQTRFIERMNPNNWEETFTGAPNPPAPFLPNAIYVDCGKTITSPGSLVLTGLAYLNGRYVVGLADGLPFGPLLVSGGSVTLPASFPATVTTVQIGLPISYAGQPMRLDADTREGNTQARTKQFADWYIRVWNSMGGNLSNGTTTYPTWVSGNTYSAGTYVISPTTLQAFECVVSGVSATDPAVTPLVWVLSILPSYQPPIPIPYTTDIGNPFAVPTLVTTPKNIQIPPALNPSPDADPKIIVSGNDALPLTVLALIYKIDYMSTP